MRTSNPETSTLWQVGRPAPRWGAGRGGRLPRCLLGLLTARNAGRMDIRHDPRFLRPDRPKRPATYSLSALANPVCKFSEARCIPDLTTPSCCPRRLKLVVVSSGHTPLGGDRRRADDVVGVGEPEPSTPFINEARVR